MLSIGIQDTQSDFLSSNDIRPHIPMSGRQTQARRALSHLRVEKPKDCRYIREVFSCKLLPSLHGSARIESHFRFMNYSWLLLWQKVWKRCVIIDKI